MYKICEFEYNANCSVKTWFKTWLGTKISPQGKEYLIVLVRNVAGPQEDKLKKTFFKRLKNFWLLWLS